MTPKKKSKTENNPQRWDCAICAKALTAPNELTFHYINHSILELAVALTNQQRVQRGLGPLEAPAEGDDSPCVDEKFEQDFYENYDNLSENENFSGEDKSNKKQVYSRKKTNDRVYSCKHCGKVLSSKGNLKKHEVLHLSVKPWQCKICNCNFNQARDLKAHQMQKHSGERPHICKICGKGFVHKFYLNEHLSYHSGDRKWQCSNCGKRFQSSSTLTKHVQRHSNDRKFSCQQCQKSFTVKVDLKSHVKLVHEKLGSTGIPIYPEQTRLKVKTTKQE